MPTKPPGTPSARTASLVTTPWRSSSWRARACARSVGAGAGCRSPATSDHRPAPAGGPVRRSAPGLGVCPGRVVRIFAEAPRTNDRSGARVSFVTSPAQTRSHSAARRRRSSAVPAAVTSSDQNDAPRSARWRRSASCTSPSGGLGGRLGEQRGSIGAEDERDAAVVGGERPRADPGHVAARHEGVEVRGTIRRGPWPGGRPSPGSRPARRCPGAGRRRRRARRRRPRGSVRALPRGEEAGERRRVDGLHLATEQGERPAAEPAEHVGFAPFATRAAGPELAAG